MKYYIDQEFQEGFHKPLFGKRRHFIDLISIGIVAEDGREYYAISNEFDIKGAWKDKWLRDNVIRNLFPDYFPDCWQDVRGLIKLEGKSNKQIAQEIIEFVYPSSDPDCIISFTEWQKLYSKPGFYGYYADYDWVLFCSLFGKMLDLPKGFPMYCRDLKQMLDEKVHSGATVTHRYAAFSERKIGTSLGNSFEEVLTAMKDSKAYPKQENEHNALADARWIQQLHKFLQSV